MGHGLRNQEDDKDDKGDDIVDVNGLSFTTSREEMFHHLQMVKDFVAVRNDLMTSLTCRRFENRIPTIHKLETAPVLKL